MQITITLDKNDWKKFQDHLSKVLPKHTKTLSKNSWINISIWVLLVFVFMFLFNYSKDFHWPTAIVLSVFFICLFAVFIYTLVKMKKAFEPSDKGVFCGEHEFTFDEEGITTRGNGYTAKHNWSIVKKIEQASGMILIYLDTAYAYVFTESKLNDPENFYKTVSELYKNNRMENWL